MNPIRLTSLALCILVLLPAASHAQDSIPWVQDLNQARRLAEQQQRLVLLHFWSDNCMPCQHVESNVFNQPELIRVISTGFIPVKIHYQQQPKIVAFYKVDRFPTDVIVLPNGAEVYRTVSPSKANAYIAMLDQVRANAMANGLQEVQQVARNATRSAQNLVDQITPILPSLPAQPGAEDPTVSPPDDVPGTEANASPDWRTASTPTTRDASPSRTVNNDFVGPLDQKTNPRPASPGQRYGNPYLDQPTTSTTTPAPAPGTDSRWSSQPAPSTAQAGVANDQPGAWQTTPDGSPSVSGGLSAPAQHTPGLTSTNASLPSGAQAPNVGGFAPGAQIANLGSPGSTSGPSAPPTPALPPNVPPLALDGYCPVTLLESHKWEQGNPQFGAIHRGRTYLFRSQVERDRFLSAGAADHYAPVLSGLDPVRFTELQQSVEGNRAFGVVYQQHIYLFADEQALVQFEQQPEKYVQVVRQAMANARTAPPQR